MTSYAAVADLKLVLQAGGIDDGDDDELFQDALDAATDWINGRTGRVFGTTETEAREFYPSDSYRLNVVDASVITAVDLDPHGDGSFTTSLSATTDYEVLPLNVGEPGVRGQLATIRIRPLSSNLFWIGRRVRVTGTWGFGAVPVRVKLACIRLAQRWFKLLREAPLGVLQAPDIGTFQTVSKADPMVDTLLQDYIAEPAGVNSWVLV